MLETILSQIDIFGIPIVLNLSRARKVKSAFGGFWSLVFLAFVLWTFYINGYELFAKENPLVNQGLVNNYRRPMDFSMKTLPVAFYIENYNDVSDAEPMACEYKAVNYINAQDVANPDLGISYDLENCTRQHLPGLEDSLSDSELLSWKCLPMDSQSDPAQVLMVFIGCENYSSYTNQEPGFVLFYPKYGFNLQNYHHPVQRYFNKYQTLAENGSIMVTLDVNHMNVTTDDGWITKNEDRQKYIKVTPDSTDVFPPDAPEDDFAGMIYMFRSEREEYLYSRSYIKIQTVLAQVGGISSTVFAVLFIFITPYARLKFGEAFVNELFEVQRKKGPKTANANGKRPGKATKKDKTKDTKDKKNAKNLKSFNDGFSGDGFSNDGFVSKDNLQALEMPRITSKGSANTAVMAQESYQPVILFKTQNDESPLKSPQYLKIESPLFSPKEREYTQVQTEGALLSLVTSPRAEKETYSDCEEGSRVLKTLKTQYPKSRIESKNPFQFDNKKSETEAKDKQESEGDKDLENPEISEISQILEFKENVQEKEELEEEEVKVQENEEERAPHEVVVVGDINNNSSKPIEPAVVVEALQATLPKKTKKVKRPKVISISFIEYLLSFVCKSESTKEKMIILKEGVNSLETRLDVFNIFKKLRDIDKVKGFMFDKDQLFLFERLPQPEIMNKSTHWFTEEHLPSHEIAKISNTIDLQRINEQMLVPRKRIEDKTQKSDVDEKLLDMLKSF